MSLRAAFRIRPPNTHTQKKTNTEWCWSLGAALLNIYSPSALFILNMLLWIRPAAAGPRRFFAESGRGRTDSVAFFQVGSHRQCAPTDCGGDPTDGFASLRRSHGRANSPPDCLLGPAFRISLQSRKETHRKVCLFSGGGGRIRTIEAIRSRFTVCPLWPLGNSPIFSYLFWSR